MKLKITSSLTFARLNFTISAASAGNLPVVSTWTAVPATSAVGASAGAGATITGAGGVCSGVSLGSAAAADVVATASTAPIAANNNLEIKLFINSSQPSTL